MAVLERVPNNTGSPHRHFIDFSLTLGAPLAIAFLERVSVMAKKIVSMAAMKRAAMSPVPIPNSSVRKKTFAYPSNIYAMEKTTAMMALTNYGIALVHHPISNVTTAVAF